MIHKRAPICGAAFWREFLATGVLHAELGSTGSSLTDHPRALMAHVLGTEADFIRPERAPLPGPALGATGESPPYVTSPSSYFPAHLLVCLLPKEAPAEAKIRVLDSWYLLQDAENRSADLYANLFRRMRVMRFERAAWVAPTFSVRDDCLIFAQPPRVGERDKIGERVRSWTTHREPVEISLGPAQILVVDNHRFAHCLDASSAMAGLEVYSVWTGRGATRPDDRHLEAARRFRKALDAAFPPEAASLRLRFGLAEASLDDYLKASVGPPTRMEELMATFKQVFETLHA